MTTPRLAITLIVLVIIATGRLAFGHGDEHHEHVAKAPTATAAAAVGDPYTLAACPVTGAELGSMGDAVVYDYHGREIRFCCEGCIADFEADPAQYIARIDETIITDQLPRYPLDTCPVTGAPLGGDMGEPVNYVYNNRLVRLCCAGCIAELESNPAKYIAQIDAAAIEQQKAAYPLDHCIVLTNNKVGGPDTVDLVVGGRLFRVCCHNCEAEILANPADWIPLLDEEYAAAGKGA